MCQVCYAASLLGRLRISVFGRQKGTGLGADVPVFYWRRIIPSVLGNQEPVCLPLCVLPDPLFGFWFVQTDAACGKMDEKTEKIYAGLNGFVLRQYYFDGC